MSLLQRVRDSRLTTLPKPDKMRGKVLISTSYFFSSISSLTVSSETGA